MEILHIVIFGAFVERAQEAIRVAEHEPRLFGRVGCHLTHLYPRLFGVKGASHSADAEKNNDHRRNEVDYIIAFVAFDFGGLVFDVVPAIDEQADEGYTDDNQGDVVLKKVDEDGKVVAIGGEVSLLEGHTLHCVREIYYVRAIDDDGYSVGNQKNAVQYALIQPFFAEAEG